VQALDSSRGLDTRSRIIEEAGALFRQHGFDRTSTTMIASRIGVSPGALYWHFPSKRAILAAVVEEQLVSGIERAQAAVTGATFGEKLRHFVYLDVLGSLASVRDTRTNAIWGALYRVLELRDVLPETDQKRIRDQQRIYLDILRDMLRDGIRCGEFRQLDVTPTAFSILNMCDCIGLWYKVDGRLSVNNVALVYADLAYHMVCASDKG
jgi:AcrR family transcriptional regulator